jgi:transposase
MFMGRQRRGFTPEYKDEAVKLVINTGRPVAVVARELGIQEPTLGRWVNVFKAHQDAGDGALSETERAEAKIAWSTAPRTRLEF